MKINNDRIKRFDGAEDDEQVEDEQPTTDATGTDAETVSEGE